MVWLRVSKSLPKSFAAPVCSRAHTVSTQQQLRVFRQEEACHIFHLPGGYLHSEINLKLGENTPKWKYPQNDYE